MIARKKPVEVHVWRISDLIAKFDGADTAPTFQEPIQAAWDAGTLEFDADNIKIHTLEGVMSGDYDDYLIRGVEGEFYACKPGIFHKTYDIVGL